MESEYHAWILLCDANDRSICVGVLKLEAWKPSTKMTSSECRVVHRDVCADRLVLLSLYDLLQAPNPDDALVTSIVRAKSWRTLT